MLDLEDIKSNTRDRAPRIDDVVAVYKFPKKKWVSIRLLKGTAPEAMYWVKTKKKDGKETKFPIPCPSFDPATQERDSTKYDPWRDLEAKEREQIKAGTLDKDDAKVQYSVGYWMRAIVRSEQKNEPSTLPRATSAERKSGFKEKDSDTWTPIYAVKLGRSFAGKVNELKGLNTVESKKTGNVKAFSVNDEKFGRDVRVYHDDTKAPADQYQVQLGDERTPLTEEEQAYLSWDLSTLSDHTFDDAAIKADFESWASRNGVKVNKAKPRVEEDDEDFEDDTPVAKKTVTKKDVAEDFDDDEEEQPKKPVAKKKPVVEDDMDDDLEEEEKPTPKKKAVAKVAVEDDFDDEEEEEKPKKPVAKKKPVVEDADDFDDEEDEKPAPKKAVKKVVEEDDFDDEEAPKKPAAKKVAKKVVEEDDFDDEEDEAPKKPAPKKKPVVEDAEDFDDEEDEDEAPKKPAAKKVAKKVVEEDDDEDF